MFSALKSMMNRVWDFIPWPTGQRQQRALTSLKTSVSQEIKKTEKEVTASSKALRKRLTDEQKRLRESLRAQKRLDRERKRAANAEKKIVRERTLRIRLLSDDEKNSLFRRLETEAMSNGQRQAIEKKLKDSKLETTRRKKQSKYKGDKTRRQKFDEKYSDLSEVIRGGINVEKTEDIGNGTSESYTITPRNPSRITVSDFLTNAKSEALKLMDTFSENYKFKMVLSTRLKKSRLINNEMTYTDMHTSSKIISLNPSLDLSEVYDEGSLKMLNVYLKKEHEGSGWTLDRIKGLELIFYNTNKK